VLQGVSEDMAQRPEDREQARVLQTQIERMSQQISYQLQRASLRKSGLVRHQVLQPVLQSLCDTLDKVYRDKRVRVALDLPRSAMCPSSRAPCWNARQPAGKRLSLVPEQGAYQPGGKPGGHRVVHRRRRPRRAADQRARILQRGERLDRQHPGQGIGLAVVKDIIESYGAPDPGRLTVGRGGFPDSLSCAQFSCAR
jgi:two-component system sensor histidine kinase PhoQ